MDPATRARLNLAKLTALAKSAGATGLTPLGFPGGAAAFGHGSLWVLTEGGLGGPLAVALKGDVPDRLVVIVDDAGIAGVIARQAYYFASPARIDVASVDGADLVWAHPVPVAGAGDARNDVAVSVPPGVDVVHEHGVTRFEVKGLEIGRIEDGEVAVGVGKHDREAHRMANSEMTLADLAQRVRAERTADAPAGLMTSVSRERWLRWIAVQHPEVLGLGPLTPVAPPLPRADLRDAGIAPAVGDDVVVAFSVGIDPDLVPSAADARGMYAPDADLVVVVPEADAVPNTYRLAGALKAPARVVTVRNDWPALGD